MSELSFIKYQGLGNDFIVVEASDEYAVSPERARTLCDRHFGIGADGVLLVLPGKDGAHARMKVLNADGSVPEMCGNGLRCVVKHVGEARGLSEVVVETDAATFQCVRKSDGHITIDMGVVKPSHETRIDVDARGFTVREVDLGNPHAVIFEETSIREAATLGPRIEKLAAFPRGVNVEFVKDTGEALDVVVWERGVGLTLACGTGACAVARAAVDRGLRTAETDIAVKLPGGSLTIHIKSDGHLLMTGPAVRVFLGRLPPCAS